MDLPQTMIRGIIATHITRSLSGGLRRNIFKTVEIKDLQSEISVKEVNYAGISGQQRDNQTIRSGDYGNGPLYE